MLLFAARRGNKQTASCMLEREEKF